ncbi:hypothetical protein F5I97DRAFT_366051 [Phlebopus sp. FC_14]|nr:hypothetical protein F5I97DRAFT_366051 [Phlebopus sp. FC_14]
MRVASGKESVLPPPVVQERYPQSSSRRISRDHAADDAATITSTKRFFLEEIDEERVLPLLSAYCFMTGFINAVCFSAIFGWCASQTGNTFQLSIAVGRFADEEPDRSFRLSDRLALCSLLSFILGVLIGRLGDTIGPKTRLWMACGTLIQTLFTMAAAVSVWKSGVPTFGDAGAGPAWNNVLAFTCLGFMSASMGLQGLMAKRLNTQFSTTVVLTSIWCELVGEPKLFHMRRRVVERDHKMMTIAACFAGGFCGRALLGEVGAACTLGVATGFRLFISAWWLAAPKKMDEDEDQEK